MPLWFKVYGYTSKFFLHCTKRDNVRDYLFAFVDSLFLPELSQLFMIRKANSFLSELTPIQKGGQNKNSSVVSPASIPIYLKTERPTDAYKHFSQTFWNWFLYLFAKISRSVNIVSLLPTAVVETARFTIRCFTSKGSERQMPKKQRSTPLQAVRSIPVCTSNLWILGKM